MRGSGQIGEGVLDPSFELGAECHGVVDSHWLDGPQVNPMSVYPQYRDYPRLWDINDLGHVVVEVESEDGSVGVGEGWIE